VRRIDEQRVPQEDHYRRQGAEDVSWSSVLERFAERLNRGIPMNREL
jgi:hypothetical protein